MHISQRLRPKKRRVVSAIEELDFYKVGHADQYVPGLSSMVTNFTARSLKYLRLVPTDWLNSTLIQYIEQSKHDGQHIKDTVDMLLRSIDREHVIVAGIHRFVQEILVDHFDDTFFALPYEEAIEIYREIVNEGLGKNKVSEQNIADLHALGYLPIQVFALPEGTKVKTQIPFLVIRETHPDFAWLPERLETLVSAEIWQTVVGATIAYSTFQMLTKFAILTGGDLSFVPYQGHDFSLRGMGGVHGGASCGVGHLKFYTGTDNIPAISKLKRFYSRSYVGGSVPACYDDQTEILTSSGFVKFSELKEGEEVAQFHENGDIDFVVPTAYFKDRYQGEMIHFTKPGYRYVDSMVTPNHRMVRYNVDKEAIELFEAGSAEYRFRKGYSHRNKLIVAGYATGTSRLTWLECLKIAFQADGSFANRADSYTGERTGCVPIRFSLKKERKKLRLERILKECDLEYTRNDYENEYSAYWIKVPVELGKLEKNFDWIDLKNVSHQWAEQFIDELQYWDGSAKKSLIFYDSINESCVDKAQAVSVLAGYKTQRSTYLDQRGDRQRIYSLACSRHKDAVTGEDVLKRTVPYDGYVYCVSVPTKMLVVRRNGVVLVCGNTEHSVACLNISYIEHCLREQGYWADPKGQKHTIAFADPEGSGDFKLMAERLFFMDFITRVYPTGICSYVSDTYDYFAVLTKVLPWAKQFILARQPDELGLCKVVVRPDSGTPLKIVCGDPFATDENERKGTLQILWEIFGGTVNEQGFKQIDSRIGYIYGDGIDAVSSTQIMAGCYILGFVSTSGVLGFGSYTYQYVTRDSISGAMKATYAVVDGVPLSLQKDPKTDRSGKKSHKGLLAVFNDGSANEPKYRCVQEATMEQFENCAYEEAFCNSIVNRVVTVEQYRAQA